jgi:tetratricopeptide (TPR) repeat protein
VFRLLGLHPGPDFTAGSAGALAGTGAAAAGPVLDRLAGAHLVTEDGAGRFGMHDLLRLYARAACQEIDSPADRETAETRLVGYYADLAGFVNSCVDPRLRTAAERAAGRDGWTLPSMREALAAFQAERPGLLAAVGLAAQRGWDEQVQRLSYSTMESLRILRYLGDLLTVMQVALAAARRAGDRAAKGQALINLGVAYQELRRFEEAVDCYQQSLAICRETGNRLGEGLATHGLGIAYWELRRFAEAIDCYQQSVAILRETGDQRALGRATNDLGTAYQGLRRFAEAVDCYQQDIAICRETGDQRGEGQALTNLGNAYQGLRRFAEAVDCYQQDIAICRETGDRHGEGQALTNLGNAYQGLRRFAEAVDCYQRALAIFRETGDRYGEGATLDGLGDAYQELREPGRAAECWREAAAAMRDAGDCEEAGRLEQLAATSRPRRRWSLRRGSPS